jgi:DNA modification methylase
MNPPQQLLLFPDTAVDEQAQRDTSSTFADNLSLPVHRWFRYSAGFSAVWAETVIRDAARQSEARVLDPFAGSGTTLLAAENAGVQAFGVEAHPFVYRIASRPPLLNGRV